VVKALLSRSKGVDAMPGDATALMEAAKGGHTEVLDALLAKGADPGKKNKAGLTARELAEQEGQAEAVLLLSRVEKRPPPDLSKGVDAIVWGGGKRPEDAERWLSQWTREAAEYRDLVVPASGYPRAVKSDEVAGMKPGFHVVVLGYCPATQTRDVLAAFKGVAERVYIRRVKLAPDHEACPTLPLKLRREALEVVGDAEGARLQLAVFAGPRGEEAWVTLRNKEGERLDFRRSAALEDCDCDGEVSALGGEISVSWDRGEPDCFLPNGKSVTAAIAKGALKLDESSSPSVWSEKCGE
jgi:hypothetical protein